MGGQRSLWLRSTDDIIAPISVIELVSCKSCKSGCTTDRCACYRVGEGCTEFCGCGDVCENVDGKKADNDEQADEQE